MINGFAMTVGTTAQNVGVQSGTRKHTVQLENIIKKYARIVGFRSLQPQQQGK
jgi:hypothetical protein